MAPKTPNNQSKKVHTDLSSPSAGSAQKVIIGSDSASDSSDSPMPPALPRTEKNKKRGVNFKSGTTTLPAANSSNTLPAANSSNTGTPSQGASALASSLEILNPSSLNEVSGKRAREEPTEDWFKNHIFETFQRLFGEQIKDEFSTEDAFSLLIESANAPYSDNTEFKNRMAALELLFRKEVDTPIPDSTGFKEIKSKGYSLLMANSFMVAQICKRLRANDQLDLGLLLQGLEFIQNISELNIINIRLGIKKGFEAAEEFSNSYKSGGSIDQITSKQQDKATKQAEKVKTMETLDKVGKWANSKPQNFRKFPSRVEPRGWNSSSSFQSGHSSNYSSNNSQHNGTFRRYNNNPNGNSSNNNNSNNNNNNNNK